jgi:transcriptional regulator with XRE-family HTH domain
MPSLGVFSILSFDAISVNRKYIACAKKVIAISYKEKEMRMKLGLYLFVNNLHHGSFAKLLGISKCHLSRAINGKSGVSADLARHIEKVTMGKVSKYELIFPEDYEDENG